MWAIGRKIYSPLFCCVENFSFLCTMMLRHLVLLFMLLCGLHSQAQSQVTAFVRLSGDDTALFERCGCRWLHQWGDIHAVSIPLNRIDELFSHPEVLRIEAGKSCTTLTDTTRQLIGISRVHEGIRLPQAYTGKGVVVGVQDVGFDLTHPNFYDPTATRYRVKRFWDQLSLDTVGSQLYVGADYTTESAILAYAHSRDGLDQTHGTHTAGIAAGSGYNRPYRGVAYESDLCLVNNVVTDDLHLVDSIDRYKYTTATDALGFQYCFDYAESVGKPCVVSFSEGSPQDLYGDDQLYYEVLERMTGPGRIIVASAGNRGGSPTYFHKPRGVERSGTFMTSYLDYVHGELRADVPFRFLLTFYHPSGYRHKVEVPSERIFQQPDSLIADTFKIANVQYVVMMAAYPNCYNPDESAYEVYVKGPGGFGKETPFSLEVIGNDADIEFFLLKGEMGTNPLDPQLVAGERRYSIHSPSSAPAVVCVGANSYRPGVLNYKGEWKEYFTFEHPGDVGSYSSVGPTLMGLTKPDVVAPGTNIISSYSSYYLENHPDANDIQWDVEHFPFNGRTYAWNCNSGTSMSAPFVAGIIALWLEACPTLTPQDVKDVLSRTCRRQPAQKDNYTGYGEIDAYAGLLDVLQIPTHDGTISTRHPSSLRLTAVGDGSALLTSDVPTSSPLTAALYTLQGALLESHTFPQGVTTLRVPLTSCPSGVYILQLTSSDATLTGSFLLRTTNN